MRALTYKLAPLYGLLCALAVNAGAQEREYADAPKLKLTVTVDQSVWRQGEAAPVRLRIENVSDGDIEMPSTASFLADNRARGDEDITTAHGVFSSPVSFTKVYAGRTRGCQDDLSPDRVERPKGGNVVVIHPARDRVMLAKGAAKEFTFDLAGTCWKHYILSFYADETIFAAAADYRPNTYRVYLLMQFRMRPKPGGPEGPLFHQLKSNAVEVTIN